MLDLAENETKISSERVKASLTTENELAGNSIARSACQSGTWQAASAFGGTVLLLRSRKLGLVDIALQRVSRRTIECCA